MQLKRGQAPASVEREIDVGFTREEILAILSSYARRKLGTDQIRFEDIQVIADKDTAGQMIFSGATLLGFEILPLSYPEGFAPVSVLPAPQPQKPIPAPSPLAEIAKAAEESQEAKNK